MSVASPRQLIGGPLCGLVAYRAPQASLVWATQNRRTRDRAVCTVELRDGAEPYELTTLEGNGDATGIVLLYRGHRLKVCPSCGLHCSTPAGTRERATFCPMCGANFAEAT